MKKTMTNEEKIREILDRHFGHHVTEGSDEWYTRNYQNRFSDLQEMAVWKEQQMIQLLREIKIEDGDIKDYGDDNKTQNYGFSEKFIKRLKQAIVGE